MIGFAIVADEADKIDSNFKQPGVMINQPFDQPSRYQLSKGPFMEGTMDRNGHLLSQALR